MTALLPGEEEEGAGEFVERFTVIGKTLESPKIDVPSTEFVRELQWKKLELAEAYDYEILRQGENNKWLPVEKGTAKKNEIKFKEKYPGGMYRLVVNAKAKARLTSESSMVEFKVYNGSRSPAAVEEARMREAIEKPTNL